MFLRLAFDCIDHEILFDKMKSCRFRDYVTQRFKSYFNRTQEVRLDNVVSMTLSITTGIGEGTILGPLIFIFYINHVIKNASGLHVKMFADDCLIYSVGNSWERKVPKIQEGFDNFYNWCCDNSLKPNLLKTKVIRTGYKTANLAGLE